MKMILWLRMAALMVALIPVWAQQPKFEIADIHNSTTLRTFALSFGGVVLNGLYINRDATMLDLIKDAYGVSDDDVAGGPGWISYDIFDIVTKVPAGTTASYRESDAAVAPLQPLRSGSASRDPAGAALLSNGRRKGLEAQVR